MKVKIIFEINPVNRFKWWPYSLKFDITFPRDFEFKQMFVEFSLVYIGFSFGKELREEVSN